MRHLAGAVVTIEAVGCQVEIARQIQEPGAAYVLRFQENQPGSYRAGVALFAWLRGPRPLDHPGVFGDDAQIDGGDRRSETGRVWSIEALAGMSRLSGGRGSSVWC